MRILMLIPTLTGAGAERQLAYLAGELRDRGHDVLAGCVARGSGRWIEQVPVHEFATKGAWNPRLILEIARLIRAFEPDIVQTCVTRMDVAGGIASMIARVPFVLRETNSAAAYVDLRSRLRSLVGRGAAAVVANSNGGAALWPDSETSVIPNAVPAEAIAQATPIARTNAEVAVYVGRLETQKNADVAIRACAMLMPERDLALYVCGDGPDRGRLEALAHELGVAGRVHFAGFVQNPWSYQRAADVALLLSGFEGHPNVVSECFAAGTPMVLSDIEPHRELAGGDALLVPPRDVAATADAIRRTLDDRPAAAERARRVSQRVHTWSIAAMTDAYENVYATARQRR
jgi:GalNAc-alpha-(1->4)-GalNAc-alpha-(1->3)-diNAcBac-PP-undecaprenol alpha-1,4-N-acetyl-D-galactosaminyltransferase